MGSSKYGTSPEEYRRMIADIEEAASKGCTIRTDLTVEKIELGAPGTHFSERAIAAILK